MASSYKQTLSTVGIQKKQRNTSYLQLSRTQAILPKGTTTSHHDKIIGRKDQNTSNQAVDTVDQGLSHHTIQAFSDHEQNLSISWADNAKDPPSSRSVLPGALPDPYCLHAQDGSSFVAQQNARVDNECESQHGKPDDVSPDVWLVPPQPTDVPALQNTWEQVMAHNNVTKSNKSETSFFKPESLIKVLHPRNIRIASKPSQHAKSLFAAQRASAEDLIRQDSNLLRRFQDGGLWLERETFPGDFKLETTIKHLKEDRSTSESEWSAFLQHYFFRGSFPISTHLMKETERRQLHSLSLKDVKDCDDGNEDLDEENEEIIACMEGQEKNTETDEEEIAVNDEEKIDKTQGSIHANDEKDINVFKQDEADTTEGEATEVVEERYPPVDPNYKTPGRKSVPMPAHPWYHNKRKRGYIYTDILYAAAVKWLLVPSFQNLIRDLPSIRIFPDSTHLGGWLVVEIKPYRLKISSSRNRVSETADYGQKAALGHALRYGTLTAAVMLHEKLKLCYMASQDEGSFSVEKINDLHVHFIAAIGSKMYHYIHSLRPKTESGPALYETHLLEEYDLAESYQQRNRFRNTLNLLHVYHAERIRAMELARIETVLLLNPAERQNRLTSRTHRWIQFFYTRCQNVFSAKDISPFNKTNKQSSIVEDGVSNFSFDVRAALDGIAKEQSRPASPTNSLMLTSFLGNTEGRTSNLYNDVEAVDNNTANGEALCNSTATITGKPCQNRAVASSNYRSCHLSSHQRK